MLSTKEMYIRVYLQSIGIARKRGNPKGIVVGPHMHLEPQKQNASDSMPHSSSTATTGMHSWDEGIGDSPFLSQELPRLKVQFKNDILYSVSVASSMDYIAWSVWYHLIQTSVRNDNNEQCFWTRCATVDLRSLWFSLLMTGYHFCRHLKLLAHFYQRTFCTRPASGQMLNTGRCQLPNMTSDRILTCNANPAVVSHMKAIGIAKAEHMCLCLFLERNAGRIVELGGVVAASIDVFGSFANGARRPLEIMLRHRLFRVDGSGGALVMFAASVRPDRLCGRGQVEAHSDVDGAMIDMFFRHPVYESHLIRWPVDMCLTYGTMHVFGLRIHARLPLA